MKPSARCYVCRARIECAGTTWLIRRNRRLADVWLCGDCNRSLEPKARELVGDLFSAKRLSWKWRASRA